MTESRSEPRPRTCRCWETTYGQMQAYLGSNLTRFDTGQMYRFVRAWHDVDQEFGPDRRAEAEAALFAVVTSLVGEMRT